MNTTFSFVFLLLVGFEGNWAIIFAVSAGTIKRL